VTPIVGRFDEDLIPDFWFELRPLNGNGDGCRHWRAAGDRWGLYYSFKFDFFWVSIYTSVQLVT
jgi:hypothetical protein